VKDVRYGFGFPRAEPVNFEGTGAPDGGRIWSNPQLPLAGPFNRLDATGQRP